MYLVAGLGNPGEKYKKTFHNMGFLAAEDLAIALDAKFTKTACKALIAEARVGTEKVLIAKPQTFMNLSGDSISELVNYYKIPLENVIIIYDDCDLEKGSLRIRPSGETGTHNGLRDITAKLSSQNFPRIRIGTHDKNSPLPLIEYVLSEIKKEDYPLFTSVISDAVSAIKMILGGETVENAMCKYNKTVK